jgi:hypothetical protein
MVKTTESSKDNPTKTKPQKDTLPSLGAQPTEQAPLTQQPPADRTGSTIPKLADLDPKA